LGGVLLAGVAGDTVGGMATDYLYRKTGRLQTARRNVILVGFLGTFCFLLPVMFLTSVAHVALALSAACFFFELIVAPIWAVPMDIAPNFAGTASGMMNFGFGLAGIISPVLFGKLLDVSGNWAVPLYASLSLLLVGAVLVFFMHPEHPFEVAQDGESVS